MISCSPGNPKATAAGLSQPAARILVVEDDPVSLDFLQFALAKMGYHVASAGDFTEAQQQLAGDGIEHVECVVTDYRLPDHTGLDLLLWIKEHDAALATIIVTADSEKQLVTESLRGGAVDFLDKPVDLPKLQAAVARAVKLTQQQRHLAESASAVKELGRTQERMLGVSALGSSVQVDLCFHPRLEAGGDFFSRYQPAPQQCFCLLTDVSGHDLQAAYISAYFQGFVRGMLEHAAPVPKILADFNRFLLEEWHQTETFPRKPAGVSASVAICAILVDFEVQTATVITHGMPAPVYVPPDGSVEIVGQTGGFPLGWFADFQAHSVVQLFARGGSFWSWTDCLADLAAKNGVSPLSLACALQQAKVSGQKVALIDEATDDILLAEIHLPSDGPAREPYRPLIVEHYHGAQSDEIDDLQAFWQRSLCLAVPELPEARLHDILLASREILLNACEHGCGGRADQKASFQMSYCSQLHTVRVRICDSGPGHCYALAQAEQLGNTELQDGHRGLLLVNHLASQLHLEHAGAHVTMEFTWPEPADA